MSELLTREVLADAIEKLTLAFPGNASGRDPIKLADVYHRALTGVSAKAFTWAVDHWIATGEFFPKVSKLRDLAKNYDIKVLRVTFPTAPRWDTCPVCGATAQYREVVNESTGELIGQRLDLSHDRSRHGITTDGPIYL